MKKNLILFFILFVFIMTAIGCGSKTKTVPVSTHRWVDDGEGFIRFYTNDKQNYGRDFWAWNNTILKPTDYVEAQVKKISGNPNYGYGIIFCLQEQEDRQFYGVLIDTTGYYLYLKAAGDTWTYDLAGEQKWYHSANLSTGYNTINTIKVVPSSEKPSTFIVYFNGKEGIEFTDSSDSAYSGGKFGFIATVGDAKEEDFPNKPVDIRFKPLHFKTLKQVGTTPQNFMTNSSQLKN